MTPDAIISDFKSVVSDLMFLSEQQELQAMLENVEYDYHREELADNFFRFSKRKELYDQIRFLNETGMEIVRVNFNNGEPYIVLEEQLQFKGGRYYFEDTFRLGRGEVFVSPFDLNIEQGKVEQPLKPAIRFGTPVFDSHGKKRGILLLNYLGAKLIHNLEMARDGAIGQTMFLNSDGFWLKGPKPEDEWGFMFTSLILRDPSQAQDRNDFVLRYEDRRNRTFGNAFPDAWQRISIAESGQFYTADGLFTFTTVYPLLEAPIRASTPRFYAGFRKAEEAHPYIPKSEIRNPNSQFQAARPEDKNYYWKLVSYVSPNLLNAGARRILVRLLLLDVVLVVALAISSWFLARASVARKQAEEETQRSLQLNAILLDSIPHPAMLIRLDRTVIAANKIAVEIGAKIGEPCWREFLKGQFVRDGEDKCWFCRADEAMG